MGDRIKCFHGNYDGRHEGMVFATNQKEAARTVGGSLSDFRNFWTAVAWPDGRAICPICGDKHAFQTGVLYLRDDQFKIGSSPQWYIKKVIPPKEPTDAQ